MKSRVLLMHWQIRDFCLNSESLVTVSWCCLWFTGTSCHHYFGVNEAARTESYIWIAEMSRRITVTTTTNWAFVWAPPWLFVRVDFSIVDSVQRGKMIRAMVAEENVFHIVSTIWTIEKILLHRNDYKKAGLCLTLWKKEIIFHLLIIP